MSFSDHPQLTDRLGSQVDFLLAIDALKEVVRKNTVLSGARAENAAEHSWHLGVFAMTFAEYAPDGTDIHHVINLLLTHDLVEIHAGDHWELDVDPEVVARKEAAAAERLFRRLPKDQRAYFHAFWEEFEARKTREARFAKALDALHPVLLVWGPGGTDKPHTPLSQDVLLRLKRPHLEAYPALWALAQSILARAVKAGTLAASLGTKPDHAER